MCTAVTFQSRDHYFGRNLDFDHSFSESVTVTPRTYPLTFRCVDRIPKHYAMIGMAMVENGYPLYYDATNEYGLSMAGLYFPGNAVYLPKAEGKQNITPFELIPWILCQCKNIPEVRHMLTKLNVVNIPFSEAYPLTPLHWIVADADNAITVEPTEAGIQVYDNPVGVLTNNPPFEYHMYNLTNYLNLTREEPTNRFAAQYAQQPYSRGMGAIGLPGDLSSSSRFVRAAFVKLNSVCDYSENASISQFFHILGSVAQQQGCVRVGKDFEKTIYSSCCNTDRGIYYYTTYNNAQITGISMGNTNLDSNKLSVFPLVTSQQIRMEN